MTAAADDAHVFGMDESVRRWRPKGKIYFWFEADPREGEGWHIAADNTGCGDIEEIVRLAAASPYPSRFGFSPPRVRGRTQRSVPNFQIHYNAKWSGQHWLVRHGDDEVTLELGSKRLDDLLSAAESLRKKEFDWAIGGDDPDQRIWLWWPPDSCGP